MDLRRIAFVLVAASCGRSIDAEIESARKRILAIDVAEASRIVAFCKSWHQAGALGVDQFPSLLPARPTSATSTGNIVTFEWWNNSHAEEDDPHPGFELVCSDAAVPGATPIAASLWYRDTPMHGGG